MRKDLLRISFATLSPCASHSRIIDGFVKTLLQASIFTAWYNIGVVKKSEPPSLAQHPQKTHNNKKRGRRAKNAKNTYNST